MFWEGESMNKCNFCSMMERAKNIVNPTNNMKYKSYYALITKAYVGKKVVGTHQSNHFEIKYCPECGKKVDQ